MATIGLTLVQKENKANLTQLGKQIKVLIENESKLKTEIIEFSVIYNLNLDKSIVDVFDEISPQSDNETIFIIFQVTQVVISITDKLIV